MLLDEVFEGVSRTKKVWTRKDGQLRLVTKRIQPTDDGAPGKPLFPISKPRYPQGTQDHFSGSEHEEAEDARHH